ncbi:MAG: hypothetical protein ACJ72T_05730 [Nitrososphaeraceae archaeon]
MQDRIIVPLLHSLIIGSTSSLTLIASNTLVLECFTNSLEICSKGPTNAQEPEDICEI